MCTLQALADVATTCDNNRDKDKVAIAPIGNSNENKDDKEDNSNNNESEDDDVDGDDDEKYANNNNGELIGSGNEDVLQRKLLRRREQIAAASRKSRERRKQELMTLKKENAILWERIDQMNCQLKKYGCVVPQSEQLNDIRKRRANDDANVAMMRSMNSSSSASSDDEDSHCEVMNINISNNANNNLFGFSSKRQKIIGDHFNESIPSLLSSSQLPMSLPHTPNHTSIIENLIASNPLNTFAAINNHNNANLLLQQQQQQQQQQQLQINFMKESIEIPSLIQLQRLGYGLTPSKIDMRKMQCITRLSEARTNWFLQHFKNDLLTMFGETLSNDEKITLSNMSIKVFQPF